MLAALFGFLRGTAEGMIMTKPGVRDHRWFKYYHAISAAVFVVFALLVHSAIKTRRSFWYWFGTTILIWEFTEIGYMLARFGEFTFYEHINMFDVISFTLTGAPVAVLHGARLAAGIALTFIGRKEL